LFRPEKIFREQLEVAEKRFGKRSHDYKLEVRGRSSETPETILAPGSDVVYVHFYDGAVNDGQRLLVQIAHEVVHVVAGAFRRDATVFEEGLAVEFSHDRVSSAYRALSEAALPPLFRNALDKFRELKATDAAIKNLRKRTPIDAITPPLLEEAFGASPELALDLCNRVSIHDADRS
jgi:hypothetical protein